MYKCAFSILTFMLSAEQAASDDPFSRFKPYDVEPDVEDEEPEKEKEE